MSRIRVALAGVGNCASALVQGIEYYRRADPREFEGLMHATIGDWRPGDVEFCAAFDVDDRKVGRPLEEAVFAPPNCTRVFQADLPETGVRVERGPLLDGVADHMAHYPEDEAFRVSERVSARVSERVSERAPEHVSDRAPAPGAAAVAGVGGDGDSSEVARALREAGAEVLVCYLPVGSEQAVRCYAEACLAAGVALVNCVPVFLASDATPGTGWADRFRAAGLPIIGDDIKSQVGATIVHRTLARLFADRGASLDRTYQLNTGGNTDFLNMLERSRLASKKRSKTESVQSQLDLRLEARDIHIGPSDYVAWQKDNKVAFIRMEGRGFGGAPIDLELRLSVEDSPNSAGVVIDAIRCAKLGLERGLAGPLEVPSAYFMKSPPLQMRDDEAHRALAEFIEAKPLERTQPPSAARD